MKGVRTLGTDAGIELGCLASDVSKTIGALSVSKPRPRMFVEHCGVEGHADDPNAEANGIAEKRHAK